MWIIDWFASRTRDPITGIRNYGEVVPGKIFRGARASREEIARLVRYYGLKSVLDLRYDERADYPPEVKVHRANFKDDEAPNPARVAACIEILHDPANQPIFVHCEGGRHRTGGVIAAYRVVYQGWTAEKAYAEAKDYGFYSALGHEPWKAYILSLR